MGFFNILKKRKPDEEAILLCPKCKVEMVKKSKQDLTIDKCRSCGGIWLDKGEIFKIIKAFKDEKK
jgi:Zn-finger nucleic acid-binding protein